MKFSTTTTTIIMSVLGSASIVAGGHCSTPGTPTAEITSPADGSTTTQQGALLVADATDSYSMMACSGCAYKFSFCPEDGGSSESLSGLQDNSPWAQIWDINTSDALASCPSSTTSTTCTIGGDTVGVVQWTPSTTGMVRIGIDTWEGGTLSNYTLAVSASGSTCDRACDPTVQSTTSSTGASTTSSTLSTVQSTTTTGSSTSSSATTTGSTGSSSTSSTSTTQATTTIVASPTLKPTPLPTSKASKSKTSKSKTSKTKASKNSKTEPIVDESTSENESSQAVPSTSQVEKEESNVDNVKEAIGPDIIVQSTFGRDSFEDEEENTVEVPDKSPQVTEKSTGIWNYLNWSYGDSNVNDDKEVDPIVKTTWVEEETENVISWSNVDDKEPTLRHVRRG